MTIKQFRDLAVGAKFKNHVAGLVFTKHDDNLAAIQSAEGRVATLVPFGAIDIVMVDDDPVDKTCQINIHNIHGWELDAGMLMWVMSNIVTRHAPQAKMIEIYPSERVPADAPAWKNPGWLEWVVTVKYRGDSSLHIHCIQRTIGVTYESHT